MSSTAESVNVSELDALMKEFPDWKEEFPEIYKDLNPPRYHKSRKDLDADPDAVEPAHSQGNNFYARTLKKKKRGLNFPQTDYQATYHKHKLRPRSTKRPPPETRDLNPPPMTFETNQRSDFVPKDLGCRPEPIKKVEEYHPATNEPFNAKTSYQREFDKHHTLPEINRANPVDFQKSHLLKANSAKFDDRTTTKEHYKKWVPQPACTFGDLPVFTDSLLYPGKSRQLETTNNATFRGAVGRRSTPCKLVEGTLKPEGAMDMDTVNQLTYHSYDGAQPAQRVQHQPEITLQRKSKFNSITQSKSDFPGFKRGRQPLPRAPAQPPQPTIDLRFDRSTNFQTEQRREFQGIDTERHPVDRATRQVEEYKAPTVKFETMTNQKLDYQPIDVSEAFIPRVPAPVSKYEKNSAKLDDLTMNKHFFKKYDVKPRVRHGDFHENHSYVPPQGRFNGVTTTHDTFRTPQDPEIAASFKPEQKPIDAAGDQDFNTMYRTYFKQPSVAKMLSRKQQAHLFKELRRRKKEGVKNDGMRPNKHVLVAK